MPSRCGGATPPMYRRTWSWNILPNFFEPVLYLVSLGVGLGAYITTMGGTSYIQFLAPGLVCVAAMNGASFEVTYNIYVRMNIEKAYDAMLTTPIQPVDRGGRRAPVVHDPVVRLRPVLRAGGGRGRAGAAASGPVGHPGGAAHGSAVLRHRAGLHPAHSPPSSSTASTSRCSSRPLFLFSSVFFPLEERLSASWLWVAECLPLLHPRAPRPRRVLRPRHPPRCSGTWPTSWASPPPWWRMPRV